MGIGPVSGQVLSIEIKNSRTGKTAMYTYSGAGPGIGFAYNRPTGWEEKCLEAWIDVNDFEGPGRVASLGAGKSGTIYIFDGPKERGKADKSVTVTFEGWDLVLSVEADAVGYWHKR